MKKIAWIWSLHYGRERCKGKPLLGVVSKLLNTKSLLTIPSNVLPLRLKQTFPPIIWIFTEGDEIKSRLTFKIFSTLRDVSSEHSLHVETYFLFVSSELHFSCLLNLSIMITNIMQNAPDKVSQTISCRKEGARRNRGQLGSKNFGIWITRQNKVV